MRQAYHRRALVERVGQGLLADPGVHVGVDQAELTAALRGDALEHVAVSGEIVVVSDDDVAARPGSQRGTGQLVQVDRHGVADEDLPSGSPDQVLGHHVASFGWQPDPLIPRSDQADTPVLVDDLGDAGLRAHRQRAERVSVEVDQVPVLLNEPIPEGRELVCRVQSLGI